ncbi:hypothetical protein AMTRI_Chr08g167840 [Amborella trichopoda]
MGASPLPSLFINHKIFGLIFPCYSLYRKHQSIRLICSSSLSCDIGSDPIQSQELCNGRWESFRKKKVVMRIGYVGTDYRGLQLQRDNGPSTVEGELETAIFKAGGIIDSNYGNIDKVGWARSSRTDKGVHSLATMISLKMEIPENAWNRDPNGINMANTINAHLPNNMKVFGVLPSQRSFDARRECIARMYSYLLPAEIIGITNQCGPGEIERHLLEFNNILKTFEGDHPFHNYTARSKYRRRHCGGSNFSKGTISSKETSDAEDEQSDEEEESGRATTDNEQSDDKGLDYSEMPDNNFELSNDVAAPRVRAKWVHEPDEKDLISGSHFRKIFSFTCGKLETSNEMPFLEICVCGESFMLHQIRKMVAAAIAVKRALLPHDVIDLSLTKFSRMVLPIAPSEVLILKGNKYSLRNLPCGSKPEVFRLIESKEINEAIENFYSSVLLPQVSSAFLDPSRPPWMDWVEKLDKYASIPDAELDEVRKAWRSWKDNRPVYTYLRQ